MNNLRSVRQILFHSKEHLRITEITCFNLQLHHLLLELSKILQNLSYLVLLIEPKKQIDDIFLCSLCKCIFLLRVFGMKCINLMILSWTVDIY